MSNDEDSCFGQFPFDDDCTRAICMFECEDVMQCKTKTKEIEE